MSDLTKTDHTNFKNLMASFLVFCFLLVPTTASAEIIDRIVARINEDVVTFYDLELATKPYLIQRMR